MERVFPNLPTSPKGETFSRVFIFIKSEGEKDSDPKRSETEGASINWVNPTNNSAPLTKLGYSLACGL